MPLSRGARKLGLLADDGTLFVRFCGVLPLIPVAVVAMLALALVGAAGRAGAASGPPAASANDADRRFACVA